MPTENLWKLSSKSQLARIRSLRGDESDNTNCFTFSLSDSGWGFLRIEDSKWSCFLHKHSNKRSIMSGTTDDFLPLFQEVWDRNQEKYYLDNN